MLPIKTEALLEITQKAGEIIMGYYKKGGETTIKTDKSPVTEADIKANNLIESELKKHYPDIEVIAEESYVHSGLSAEKIGNKAFFLVDPLDGTKSFIRGSGEFTVNIGLIINKKPVAGVILSPVTGDIYYVANNELAYKKTAGGMAEEIHVNGRNIGDPLGFVVSHSHYDARIDDFLKSYKVREKLSGSSSIKFCMVAEGKADIYPRFGRTMEWDTAAGHAILLAAGGTVKTPEGKDFLYSKPGFENGDFIACGTK